MTKPKTQKPQRLPFSAIEKDVSIYNEFVEFPIQTQGKEYIVKFYPYFSNTKIRDLIQELANFAVNIQKEELDFDVDAEFSDVVGYFIMRHFTDIKFTTSKKAKVIYEEYKMALNSDLFKVITECIPEESSTKLYDAIYKTQEMSAKLEGQLKKLQQDYLDLPLENRSEIENAFGKKEVVN